MAWQGRLGKAGQGEARRGRAMGSHSIERHLFPLFYYSCKTPEIYTILDSSVLELTQEAQPRNLGHNH